MKEMCLQDAMEQFLTPAFFKLASFVVIWTLGRCPLQLGLMYAPDVFCLRYPQAERNADEPGQVSEY